VANGSSVGLTVAGVLGVKVFAASNRSATKASTVAPTSTVGGTGDPGTTVGLGVASALEQPRMNTAATKNAVPDEILFLLRDAIVSCPENPLKPH